MKRHESLAFITREHQEGLILARLLQHGAPIKKGMPITPASKSKYVQAILPRHLSPHFRVEEQTIFILAKEGSPELQEKAQQLQQEHYQMEQLIRDLPKATNHELPDKLNEVGHLLEQHIRSEEHVFFEQLQQEFSEEQLRSLKRQIESFRMLY